MPHLCCTGCEGLPDTSSSFPTLVSVTRSTFCPGIRFLGFCLFSGLGVFEGDSLLPELKCSGLMGWSGVPQGPDSPPQPEEPRWSAPYHGQLDKHMHPFYPSSWTNMAQGFEPPWRLSDLEPL